MTVAIVDYGMGNTDSVARAVERCGGDAVVTHDRSVLRAADHLVLPGVGAFPDAMAALTERGLTDVLLEQADAGVPLLGICLGMQMLARTSDEVRPTPGLGLVDAEVVRLRPRSGERVPHMGWNEVHPVRPHPLLGGMPAGTDVYFVHGYHVRCTDPDAEVARTPFAGGFTSVVAGRNAVVGTQFHPEKSQRAGLAMIEAFLAMRPAPTVPGARVAVGASC